MRLTHSHVSDDLLHRFRRLWLWLLGPVEEGVSASSPHVEQEGSKRVEEYLWDHTLDTIGERQPNLAR